MTHAYICDAQRTPFGRYGGGLAGVRADDLGAVPIRALMARNPDVDWTAVTDVLYGCANQAGEDNRNVARMAALLQACPTACRAPPEPPVRLGPGRHRQRRALHQGAKRIDDCRRRGKHEPAPFVMARRTAPFRAA